MEKQIEFIQNVLIDEIGDIVLRHPFLSFTLISSAIELLGASIEKQKKSFFGYEKDKSSSRFKNAIYELFPERYHIHANILYTDLRSGMSHALLPKEKIGLSERKHGRKNLETDNSSGLLILVAEDFYDDFKNACLEVISKLKSKEISPRFNVNLV